jgi:hypothetical protein
LLAWIAGIMLLYGSYRRSIQPLLINKTDGIYG